MSKNGAFLIVFQSNVLFEACFEHAQGWLQVRLRVHSALGAKAAPRIRVAAVA